MNSIRLELELDIHVWQTYMPCYSHVIMEAPFSHVFVIYCIWPNLANLKWFCFCLCRAILFRMMDDLFCFVFIRPHCVCVGYFVVALLVYYP